jgi:DNA repair exonuclease SbcCD nuclease subunit
MKIALITDTHFGCRGDNLELLNAMVAFYRDQFFPIIKEQGCEHIIHLGDLVDRRKYVNFHTLNTMRTEFLDRIDIPMDIICGNHDTYYKNTNQLNSLEELLAGRYENIKFYTEATQVNVDCPLLYIPWVTEENVEHMNQMLESTDAAYAFGHLELTGFQMMKGMQCMHGLNHKLFTKFHSVFSGHFHYKSSFDNIHYLGSPYHMNWTEAEGTNGFHIFDTNTGTFEFYENPHSMFNKLFFEANTPHEDLPDVTGKWVKVIVKEKPDPYLFETWCDKLTALNPLEMKIVEPITQVSEDIVVSEADDTPTIIDRAIDANLVMEDSDKDQLKKLMHELYNEATNVMIEK